MTGLIEERLLVKSTNKSTEMNFIFGKVKRVWVIRKMNPDIIPKDLHYLIEMVEKWGLSDDGYRDEQLFNASKSELKEIIRFLPDEKLEILNDWLVGYADDKIISVTKRHYPLSLLSACSFHLPIF